MIILLTKLQHPSKLQWAKLPDGHEKPVLQCWTVKLALKFLSNSINTGVGSIIVFDTGVQPARVMNPNWAWGTLEPHFTFLWISHITYWIWQTSQGVWPSLVWLWSVCFTASFIFLTFFVFFATAFWFSVSFCLFLQLADFGFTEALDSPFCVLQNLFLALCFSDTND